MPTDIAPARISVGFPVYNGERYVEAALKSLQDQTVRDIEIVICDNASTDRTEEICRDFAAADPRFRYFRNAENIGVNRNFNRCLELSTAPYFHWAAADDLCDPALLEALSTVLDSRPDVVLSYARTREIDSDGMLIRSYADDLTLDSDIPSQRWWLCLQKVNMCNPLFGLFRSAQLRKTGLFGNYSNSDIVLLCELSLHGKIVEVPQELFFRRMHDGMAVRKYPTAHARMQMSKPKTRQRLAFPNVQFFFGFLAAVWRAPLSFSQRLRGLFHLRVVWKRWRGRLWEDFTMAFRGS